eukprot:TRINITY_DN55928_c0_g1_i1.p1 TRINITY_DN55928_c0_g1~~TRINITY_DN55928_c0_g1_i1.p1  ORF type:complete len:105 (-),score=18.24 TRINITY_DN55928_c0_g1_i1:278-592(-)
MLGTELAQCSGNLEGQGEIEGLSRDVEILMSIHDRMHAQVEDLESPTEARSKMRTTELVRVQQETRHAEAHVESLQRQLQQMCVLHDTAINEIAKLSSERYDEF